MSNEINRIFQDISCCDEVSASFFIRLKDGQLEPDITEVRGNILQGSFRIDNTYRNLIKETVFLSLKKDGAICHRELHNISGKVIRLVETGILLEGLHFGEKLACEKNFFYHTENPRIYNLMTIPLSAKRSSAMVEESEFDAVAGNKWADPGVVSERIGASPYQPFPAIILSNYEAKKAVVHGTLSQRVFYHNYLAENKDGRISLQILSSFKAIEYREFAPEEIISDDRWYLGTADSPDISEAFRGYREELRRHLPCGFGQTDINRHSVIWGSWNDGIFTEIDSEKLLKTAVFLKENLPSAEWLQIDAGYANDNLGGLSVPYEENGGIDKKKFPEGLRNFTDRVKEAGIRPALWIGGVIHREKSKLGREKPEWFIDYSYRFSDNGVLDVSIPEVREYMAHALDILVREYGFEGIKHDFWSYVFEDSNPLLGAKTRSGYEWRSWWLGEMRKRIPAFGYLQTGCDIVMGNPFLGEYFTNYRYGIDIGDGDWNNIVTNMLWGAACCATHCGAFIVPNSDSIGLFPGLEDREAMTWINYCLISRSLVEIAGWLYPEPDNPRQYWLKKAVCCPNNGEEVFFAGYDYRKEKTPPDTWYFKGPHFSLVRNSRNLPARTVAVFNLSEEDKTFTPDTSLLGLPAGQYIVTDIWGGRSRDIKEFGSVKIKPRASILLAINEECQKREVLDADIKTGEINADKASINIQLVHAGSFSITLRNKPRKILVDGEPIQPDVRKGDGNWKIEGKSKKPGILRILY